MSTTPQRFPILDEELLMSMPKARKPQDIERMLTSPNSEDWVTWNLVRALQQTPSANWWAGVVVAAEADAGHSAGWSVLDESPAVDLWRTVSSPPAYEAASRRRMATSDNEEWRSRAGNTRPVEGATEVDLVFDGPDYLVFVEAKLHSDVSLSTTYGPDRNQIVRNIDCVIEEAGDREPFFWMLVRDRSPERLYMQLIATYRDDPSKLRRLLPHRDPAVLAKIIKSLAVITWEDLLPLLPTDRNLAPTMTELHARTTVTDPGTPNLPNGPKLDPRLATVLPLAPWNAVPTGVSASESIHTAVAMLDVEGLRRRTMSELVPGLATLGETPVNRDHAPQLIRWRLLPLLPATWGEIGHTTIGEMLSFDGIGAAKLRALIEFAAHQTLDVPPEALQQDPTGRAPNNEAAIGALRTIAAWGAATGHTTFLEALTAAARGGNDSPLTALEELERVDLATFAGQELVRAAGPLEIAQEILESLSERDRTILERRILRLDPAGRWTLAQLGDELDLTRERVRQLELKITRNVHAAVARPASRPIQRLVGEIRRDLGTACPFDEAHEAIQPDSSNLVDELLTWLAGPYVLSDGWLVRHETTLSELALGAFNAVQRDGIAERLAVIDELVLLGVDLGRAERLVEQVDVLGSHNEYLFLPAKTIADRAEIHLRLSGKPMSYDELFALDVEADSLKSFRSAINASPNLRRLTRNLVGLTAWEGLEYPGVVKAMIDEIDASGGSITVDELSETLEKRFGISRNSVSIHASMNPMFVATGGSVKLRTYSQPYQPETDLTASHDCFLIDGRWALRVPIDGDVLRGSGQAIPEAFAVYIGIQPFGVREIDGPARHVHAAWKQAPNIGSIRLNVLDLELTEGDHAFLRFGVDGALEFLGLPRASLDSSGTEQRLRLLTGNFDSTDRRQWPEVLASSIGLSTSAMVSTEDLLEKLKARRQDDVLELVEQISPGSVTD